MLVADLHERIRNLVVAKNKARELSQSALAERIGVTQAHLSNFVNGRRGLSIESLDSILSALELDVEDLLPPAQTGTAAGRDAKFENVPLVELRSAMRPQIPKRQLQGMVSYKKDLIRRIRSDSTGQRDSWLRFIAIASLSDRSDPMYPRFGFGAISLIDRHYCSLDAYHRQGVDLYLVRKGKDYLIRYVELRDAVLVLRAENNSSRLDFIKLTQKRPLQACIVGRVAHICAET